MKLRGIIAKKVGMTRMLDDKGALVAVTLLEIPNQTVTKICTPDKEGYKALQVGFQEKAEKNLNKSDIARLRKVGVNQNYASFTEFRCESSDDVSDVKVGVDLSVDLLKSVPLIDISGLTKGRGFTGSVKRWNTACGRMSHGSRFHRRPGSLGTRTTPGRVFKGKPVHGHYGNEKVTVLGLRVMDVDIASRTVAVRGSVPGHRDGVLFLTPSVKG